MDCSLSPEQEWRVQQIEYIFQFSNPTEASEWEQVVRRLVYLGFHFSYIHRLYGDHPFSELILLYDEPIFDGRKHMKVYYCSFFLDSLYVQLEDISDDTPTYE